MSDLNKDQELNQSIAELMDEFGTSMQELLDDEPGRKAVAAKIARIIQRDIELKDLSGLVLNKEFIRLGEQVEWIIRGKMKAYWHEPGSYAPRTRTVQKVFTVPTDMLSCHPEMEIGQLKAGRYGTMQDQIREARNAILAQINAMVWNTLCGAVPNSTTYGNLAVAATGTAVTKAEIDTAIDYLEDKEGGAGVIIGRSRILNSMRSWNTIANVDAGIWDDATKKAFWEKNIASSYRGLPIVALKGYKDGYGKQTIQNHSILVVGKDIGKFVVNEDIQSMDGIDIDTLMWHIHLYMRAGCSVWFSDRIYRICGFSIPDAERRTFGEGALYGFE